MTRPKGWVSPPIICRDCGAVAPRPPGKQGVSPYCPPCRVVRVATWRAADLARQRVRRRERNRTKPSTCQTCGVLIYTTISGPPGGRKFCPPCRRESDRVRQRDWRIRNRDRDRANGRRWYARNIDRTRARGREWARAHPVIKLAGQSVLLHTLPPELQEVARLIRETRQEIRRVSK